MTQTLHGNQHGFRPQFSCDTQLAGFCHDLTDALNSGVQVDVVFLDFKKAFDVIPHIGILHKLTHLKLDGKVVTGQMGGVLLKC